MDTAFVPGGAEEPELFIAVASQQPIALDAFAVVQLPYRSVISGAASDDDAERRARSAEQAARGKVSELEAELLTERQAVASRDAKLREAETRVFARDAELSALRQQLEGNKQLLKAQELQIAELSAPRPVASNENDETAAELTALEQALTERGEHVRKLERELREAERVGKELLRQLPAVAATATDASSAAPRAELDEGLAQKLAKTQADLIATRWALEAALRRAPLADAPEA